MAEIVRSTRIDLGQEARDIAIDCLNENLANTIYAALTAKFAHWNVKGAGFLPAHKFFDKLAEFFNNSADTIAERITALGGNAEGLLHEVASFSNLAYEADANDNVATHQKAMADILGAVGNGYRRGIEVVRKDDVNDQATQDVFIELCREADKLLYFLEAELRRT